MELDFGSDDFSLETWRYSKPHTHVTDVVDDEEESGTSDDGYKGDNRGEGDDEIDEIFSRGQKKKQSHVMAGADEVVKDAELAALYPVSTKQDAKLAQRTATPRNSIASTLRPVAAPVSKQGPPTVVSTFPVPAGKQSKRPGTQIFETRFLSLSTDFLAQHDPALILAPLPLLFDSAQHLYSSLAELCLWEGVAVAQESWIRAGPLKASALPLTLTRWEYCEGRKEAKDKEATGAGRQPHARTRLSEALHDRARLILHSKAPLRSKVARGKKEEDHTRARTLWVVARGNHMQLGLVDSDGEREKTGCVTLSVLRQGWWDDVTLAGGGEWRGWPLCGLLNVARIYSSCHSMPTAPFLKELLGNSSVLRRRVTFDDDHPEGQKAGALAPSRANPRAVTGAQLCAALNASQSQAVRAFLETDTGLHLCQGPPGTGKSHMLATLLLMLWEQASRNMKGQKTGNSNKHARKKKEEESEAEVSEGSAGGRKAKVDTHDRTLVCGPSNKSVHVLLAKFLRLLAKQGADFCRPNIALAGVEEMLPTVPDASETGDGAGDERATTIAIHDSFIHTFASHLAVIPLTSSLSMELITALQHYTQHGIDNSFLRRGFASWEALLKRHESIATPQMFAGVRRLRVEGLKNNQTGTTKSMMPNRYRLHWRALWLRLESAVEDPQGTDDAGTCLRNLVGAVEAADKKQLDLDLINAADVIFCTLSVAGRHILRTCKRVRTLIVDEAACACEAEVLVSLSAGPRRALMVGDPSQLSATVISRACERAGYGRSTMERLMATRHPYTLLDTQYRMHPDISCFPSVRFYAGRVKDATGMAARAGLATNPLGTTGAKEAWLGPYTVVDVASGCEARAASGSLHNDAEAEMVVLLVRAVRDKCGERNVAVITFYAAQVTCISAALRRGGLRGVQVYTVDSFQGSEEEVVVLSFVRANPRGQKGFLDDFRRLNVALTRAKKALLMACHVDTLAKGGGDLAELMQDARIRGVVVHESVVRQQLAVRSSVPFKRRMGHSGAAGPAKLAVPPKEKRKLKRKMT